MNPQPISLEVLLEKYAKHGETGAEEIFARVADALAAPEKSPDAWRPRFLSALESGFIPAGRIMSAAGTGMQATLINCFVQPVGDSVSEEVDGRPGIYTALAEAAETMRRGGGVGYDFSAIRPKGARVHTTESRASGPVSYMRVFDRSCETVESAGARRGAQMGILRCEHPDIFEFVRAKDRPGELTNFNLSVALSEHFMQAVETDGLWDLTHRAEPSPEQQCEGAHLREDGLWVYRSVPARELWDLIMRSTYDHAEPGVLFIDRMNRENNLGYCERIEATNPCAEQPLPAYGCCCLGSLDLARFVAHPFTPDAAFEAERFAEVAAIAVRMLDNVLDATYWPLERQREEAKAKRRIGLGFTGLGDALAMLGLRYDSAEARDTAAGIGRRLRDAAYLASVDLAQEKGAFPRFDAAPYLASPFIAGLPEPLRARIRKSGIRNSHLLSIAPTGTISLAFADNASNGIEPPYAWTYVRKKREADGSTREYPVEDHAYRLYRAMAGERPLPSAFVTALDISALDHMRMLAAVQPYIDSSISKTVNVPADYPYADFQNLYLEAWKAGLKGLATYRPNPVTGAILEAAPATGVSRPEFDESDPDRRLRLDEVPTPALASLRWRRRPRPAGGNPAWSYLIDHPLGSFAVFIGHVEDHGSHPFEVWVNGAEQPRGLGALAKSLSMDMRSNDRGWLKAKLESLMKAHGDDGFELPFPPDGRTVRVPSLVAGFARLIYYRCAELGAFDTLADTPVLNALMSPKEPKTGPDGTLSWTVDILNVATGDDFVMGLKELILPNGQRRPYSIWLSGEYPRVLDGLCKSLSFDMRVIDPAWVGAKLRQLLDFPEPRGDFLARIPGSGRQRNYPSTVAYMARLAIHRYAMLGLLDEEGQPLQDMGLMDYESAGPEIRRAKTPFLKGARCPECGNDAVIRRDGCDFCTACGALGGCG
ncbi:adenosylcobalamin-dependent ribonucleoside-diphosphate reductase [Methylococcus mesophilus]|uniref:adenosylcobalamin-dependent ribonucleoside-diphosphate reductase n=1 Tax=Methylococcus mesophilus TaxID=2993564 RepID=UPI00224AD6ED|nr:adenosylcobalamin-dependent ribonucleoside-diphosphate reductase [Methylococcus mesophilus]UZR28229.1 adenosylcobalamin-dependent ribonucleoside-diphosphate reductase [Methylococcus mesophilus]